MKGRKKSINKIIFIEQWVDQLRMDLRKREERDLVKR